MFHCFVVSLLGVLLKTNKAALFLCKLLHQCIFILFSLHYSVILYENILQITDINTKPPLSDEVHYDTSLSLAGLVMGHLRHSAQLGDPTTSPDTVI